MYSDNAMGLAVLLAPVWAIIMCAGFFLLPVAFFWPMTFVTLVGAFLLLPVCEWFLKKKS
jgi:hypothetical protein